MGGKFSDFDDDVAEPGRLPTDDKVVPLPAGGPGKGATSEPDDESRTIKLLAEQMMDRFYHPVLVFGSANSGKTSMLLSLFAALATDVELRVGMTLSKGLVSTDSIYGAYLEQKALEIFESRLQKFIEGAPAPSTKVDAPIFLPIELSPASGQPVNIAVMEGNGEWYQPSRSGEHIYLARAKASIEMFMRSYQGAMSFIYVLPYTQKAMGSTQGVSVNDDQAMKDASLAIKGVITQYREIRAGSCHEDRHLLLVTKWDAKFDPTNSSAGLIEVLEDDVRDVKNFVAKTYSTAVVAFQAISGVKSKSVRNYCAGRMTLTDVQWPAAGTPLHHAVSRYPVGLWRWIYAGAVGKEDADPFPPKKVGFLDRIANLLGKIF